MTLRTNEVSQGAAGAIGTPLRVLLVEDSENDALLLLRELRRGGYELICDRVETPEAMEAALEGEAWDAIISDYYLPRFSAPAALEVLREKGLDLPFIVVSGKVGEEAAVEMMRAGAHDYVTKENMARLIPAIERELQEAAVRRDRQRSDAALRESEERFRLLVEGVKDYAIFMLGPEGHITTWNEGAQRINGYEAEEILGKHFLVFYTEEDLQRGHPEEELRVATVEGRYEEEGLRVRKDGSRFWASVLITALRDETGELRGFSKVVRDVTERKRAEEALRKSESSLSAAQRIAHLGNWDYDVARNETYWSDELYRIFGFTPQAFVPTYKKFLDLVHPDDKEFLRREVRAALYEGRERNPSSVEYRVVRPDGKVRFVSTQYEVVRDESGRSVRLIGTIYDITERKRTQWALQEIREAERNRMARDLHDGVLQDLSYIALAMQITRKKVEGTDLQEELQGEIDGIRRAVEGLREAVYDLRLGEENRPFLELVESLVEQNRRMAPDRDIWLDVEEGLPSVSFGHVGTELLRIVQEALTNARRHSGARRVRVTLWAEGDDLVAEVSDDGRGFETETAPGIGLRSMRERAAALSGKLDVQSKPGEGTRVRLRAPLPGLLRKRLTSS